MGKKEELRRNKKTIRKGLGTSNLLNINARLAALQQITDIRNAAGKSNNYIPWTFSREK